MNTLALALTMVLAVGPYVPDSSDYLADADLHAAGLQRYWESDLPLEPGDGPVAGTLRDESLYVATRQGNLVALHAPTGLALWARHLAGRATTMLAPTHLWTPAGPGPTAVVVGREVHVFDRLTGEPLAEFTLDFAVGTPAVGDLEVLFAGGLDGQMHALRWGAGRAGRPVRLWEVRTGGPICSEPVFDGRNLFFASAEGRVYSCVGFNRVLNWAFPTGGSVRAGLLLHQGGVYVAGGDRSLYRLDDGVGLVRWQRRLPTPLDDAPVVAGQTVYQYGPEEGLFAVELDSGELLWRCSEARAFVAARGEEAYLASADGEHLLAVDNRTGQVLRSLEIPDTAVVVSNPRDDGIYLVSAGNRVLCLRPADVPYLTLEEIAAVRARLSRSADRTDEAMRAAPATETRSQDNLLDDPLRSRRDIAPVSGG